MTVRVIARTHPFRDSHEEWIEAPGTTVDNILRRLTPLFRKLPITVLINGVKILKDKWIETHTKDGDLVNIKVMPAGGKGGLSIIGAGVGLAGLGLAAILGKSKANNAAGQPATQNNNLVPPPEPAPDPEPVPVDGFGGYKDAVMPQITGVSNQANLFGPVPRVYGTMRMNPVLAAQPYYTIEGNDQWLYAIFSCGLGRLDISEIKIGAVDIQTFVDAGICQYEVLTGANPNSEEITLYLNDVASTSVGTVLTSSAQTVVASQSANQLAVDVTFPNGLYGRDEPTYTVSQAGLPVVGPFPATAYYANVAQTCAIKIEYRLYGSGDPWTERTLSVTANEQGVKRATDIWSVTEGLYEVRLSKTTSDAVVTYTTVSEVASNVEYQHYVTPVHQVQWTALKAIRTVAPINKAYDVNGNVIPITYIGIKVKASELVNGVLENLSCLCKSYLRTYNGSSWDSPSITANPAWVFADIITGTINGSSLDDTYLNLPVLKDWADFCDSKSFTYNDVIDDFVSIPELLKRVAACGRASINAIDGLIGVFCDKPNATVVQQFTPADTIGLKYSRTWPRVPHAIKVNFINPDADWVQDQRIVYADGYTSANATLYETYDFRGVTSAAQAWRLARYQHAVARLRPVRYTLKVDWQHLICNRGDRVYLNYDVINAGLGSGLINSVTDDGVNQTGIILNQEIYLDPAKTYGVKIRLSDNTTLNKQIDPGAGGWTSTLTYTAGISLATSPLPARNNSVAFGYFGTETIDCLVEEINHDGSERTATLTLVDYAPSIYDADTGTIPAYTPQVSIQHPSRRTIDPPVIAGIVSDESVLVRGGSGSILSQIQISVNAPTSGGTAYLEAQYRKNGNTAWLPGQSVPAAGIYTTTITGVEDGATYNLRVRFVDNVGVASTWTTADHVVIGKSSLPPSVPDIRLQGDFAIWTYDITAGVDVPLDHAGFRVKYALGQTNNWDSAIVLVNLQQSQQYDMRTLPTGPISFMVKAVDVAGNECATVAVLYRNITGTLTENLYISTDEHTAWSGTKTNFSIDGGELVADDSGVIFWKSGAQPFWNSDPASDFWDVYFQDAIYEWEFTPDATIRDPYKIYLDYDIDAEAYFVEYRRQSQTPFWDTDPDSMFWDSDTSSDFWDDQTAWLPYPQGGIDGGREKYYFRVRCLASSVQQATIHTLTTRIDVPDVEETIEQVISSGGERLTLTETYYQIVDCQVTLLFDASYTDAFTVQVIDRDATLGPLIKVFDVDGNDTDGRIIARLKGY